MGQTKGHVICRLSSLADMDRQLFKDQRRCLIDA